MCASVGVRVFVCVCVCEMYFLTMSSCCERSCVCSTLDNSDMDLAGSEPLTGSSFPWSPSSLHPSYGRHGPAKQTVVHLATWLELYFSYESYSKPYTPRSLSRICVLCMGDSEEVCFSAVALFALWFTSLFSADVSLLLTSIWTHWIDSGWLFAIHLSQPYSQGLYLT